MMKKLFLLTLLVAGVMMGVEAQNRSIDFEQTKEWKKVLKKAKKEKKLIFVDCTLPGAVLVRCWLKMYLPGMK